MNHIIIQRGHNRQVVFASNEDYLYCLSNLKEWMKGLGCKIYAFCLMTNHVHLIVDLGHEVENLAFLMKRVSGRQTRYVNRLEGRKRNIFVFAQPTVYKHNSRLSNAILMV